MCWHIQRDVNQVAFEGKDAIVARNNRKRGERQKTLIQKFRSNVIHEAVSEKKIWNGVEKAGGRGGKVSEKDEQVCKCKSELAQGREEKMQKHNVLWWDKYEWSNKKGVKHTHTHALSTSLYLKDSAET